MTFAPGDARMKLPPDHFPWKLVPVPDDHGLQPNGLYPPKSSYRHIKLPMPEFFLSRKVPWTVKIDDNMRLGRRDMEERASFVRARPILDTLLRELLREIQEEREAGTLRPFVEREPIGAYKYKPTVCITDDDVIQYRKKSREWARMELIALRAKNEHEIERFLRRT